MACKVDTPMTASLEDRLRIARTLFWIARRLLPPEPRVVDLGCGHCLFLKLAIEVFGARCSGIDARPDRVPDGMPVSIGRVQDADLSPYDLILCLGILYHMTIEDQVALVGRFEGKPAIVDTHYGKPEEWLKVGDEVYNGSTYREGNKLTSSFGNRESFWLAEPDLVKMLSANHDVVKWLPEHHPGRSFYVMLPRTP
jgi:hypothetical protein